MVNSKVYPGLERKPGGPDNWVEATGGLPSYIERIAKHLHYEKGMTIQHAIATAVNTVKRWARKGGVVKYGDPNNMHVTTVTAAQAAKAVAAWEAKKAAARGTSAGGRRHGRISLSSVDSLEGGVTLKALAERANAVSDPELKATARRMVIDLALPQQQKCKFCDESATKRVVHSEGMAYIPTCDGHLDQAKDAAAKCTPDGSSDPSNIDRIADLSEVIDLAKTKDGRKSFARQGKWGHGFVPLDDTARRAKAKGSPIAGRRISRLFGGAKRGMPSKPNERGDAVKGSKPHMARKRNNTVQPGVKISTSGGPRKGGAEERVQTAGKARHIKIKDSRSNQRVKPDNVEVSRGRARAKRSTRAWEKIPDEQKVVRNGKRYVLTTFDGQQMLTEWTGGQEDVAAPDPAKRQMASITTADAMKMSTAEIRRMLKVPGQPENVLKVLNAALRAKSNRGVLS